MMKQFRNKRKQQLRKYKADSQILDKTVYRDVQQVITTQQQRRTGKKLLSMDMLPHMKISQRRLY